MSETSAAARRRARRIPDEFRKRNAQSCDLCRKRRCKCIPSPEGGGCVACQENNVACSYMTPRKTRFYGSLDDLGDRYRCLEAIVKGAFPNDTVSTVADLLNLGRRMGYHMPDLDATASRSAIRIEDLIRTPESLDGGPRAQDSASISVKGGPALSSGSVHPLLADGATEGILTAQRNSATLNVASEDFRPPPLMVQDGQVGRGSRSSSSGDERQSSLIRDTSGNEHYIGPSGTLNFLSQLRRLLVSTQLVVQHPEGVSRFAKDDTAQALEADEQDDDHGTAADEGSLAGLGQPVAVAAADGPHDALSPGSISSSIARDFTRLPTVDMEEALRQLPKSETLEHLVASYFQSVHDDFPLFHRATFEDEFELYLIQGRRTSKVALPSGPPPIPDWGWIGCIHMMMVFGSISNPAIEEVDHATLRRSSVTVVRTLLPQFVSKCTLSNVRVLLLLSLFLHNNNERNAAWNLTGTATRISFALGLHRSDISASFRPLEREVRKWVFCTLYSFEQFLASSLGRPSGMHEMDVEIVPPREGFVGLGGGTDANIVALSTALQGILAKNRSVQGARHGATASPASTVPPVENAAENGVRAATPTARPTTEDILNALDAWKKTASRHQSLSLPSIKMEAPICWPDPEEGNVMTFDILRSSLAWKTKPQLRAVLLLHIQYHYIAIVATRPTLLSCVTTTHRYQQQQEPLPQQRSTACHNASMTRIADICVKHACQLTLLVLLLDSFQMINGLSGLDIFYAYCAAMVLILRLLKHEGVPDASEEERAREQGIRNYLRDLVPRVQLAINNADKSGSMKRFARVVDAFAECTTETGRQRFETSRPTVAGGMATPHRSRFFGNGVSATAALSVPNPGDPTMGQIPPHVHSFRGAAPGGNSDIDMSMDVWPLSTFGALGAMMDEGAYMNPFSGGVPAGTNEWAELDMVLASYGVP